jgi:hypothetical protein
MVTNAYELKRGYGRAGVTSELLKHCRLAAGQGAGDILAGCEVLIAADDSRRCCIAHCPQCGYDGSRTGEEERSCESAY